MNIARASLVLTFILLLTTPPGASAQTEAGPYDLLITGGRIVDGTGNPWFSGDVAIRDDRIVAVGHLADADAARVIDATGLVVAPGFIDLHTHSDGRLLNDGTAQSKVRQGVTLDVAGESSSQAPRDGMDTPGGGGWTTFTGYFQRLEEGGISMNLISHVSYHQIRRVVKGFDESPANPAELERMKELTARSMEEGAWGLVTRFGSGGPRHPEEVLELARIVASYGGNYTSHHGSEGYQQEREIDFAIRVAEEIGIPVHLFHFKIRARNNWGTIDRNIDQIAQARAGGLDITANQYPYTAMFHGWSSFFPLWVREDGPDAFARRLRDDSLRERIKSDPDFIAWAEEHGWWEGIVLARASLPEVRRYEGMRVAEIAEELGVDDPADVVIDLMAAEGGSISGIFHTMSEEDVPPHHAPALGGARQRRIRHQPGCPRRPPSTQLRNRSAGARALRSRRGRARTGGCRPQDDVPAGADPGDCGPRAGAGGLRRRRRPVRPGRHRRDELVREPEVLSRGDSLRDRQRDPGDRPGRAHRRPAGKGYSRAWLPAGGAGERRGGGVPSVVVIWSDQI